MLSGVIGVGWKGVVWVRVVYCFVEGLGISLVQGGA